MQSRNWLIVLFTIIAAVNGEERPAVRACNEFKQVVREKSPESHFPYMAAINSDSWKNGNGTKLICSGTLIDKKFVLMSAACVDKAKYALLGATNLADIQADNIVEVPIKTAHKHSEYSRRTLDNDIAVLELEHEVEFNKFIFPICLYTENNEPTDNLEVISWNKYAMESNLQRHKIEIEPLDSCNNTYVKHGQRNHITVGNICANSAENAVGLCHTISGAPLISPLNAEHQMFYQIGFISYGSTACGSIFPDILTRISYYIEFIEKIVWP